MEELIQYIMAIRSREPSDYGKLINMLITDNNLREYVDKIVINNTNCLGMYIPNKKELRININRIARKAFMKSFEVQSTFNIDPERFATLCVLATVFHELYHVEQTKMCFDSSDDTLHKIVREGIELGRRSPNRLNVNERLLYRFRYLDVLTERSAEVNSTVKVLMCRKSGAVLANECRFFRYYLNSVLSRGYQNDTCPSELYYRLRGKQEEYSTFDFNDSDYDLLTRLAWGLPVDEEVSTNPEKSLLLLK